MARSRAKQPIWHESLRRRHAYQAWVGPDCAVAIVPDKDQRWRWRVGRGDLTVKTGPFEPVQGVVAKEGVVETRQAAKRAAMNAAKKACPVVLGRPHRR
jgi:hypothetical protein